LGGGVGGVEAHDAGQVDHQVGGEPVSGEKGKVQPQLGRWPDGACLEHGIIDNAIDDDK
jgi:hypothetical protein